MTRNDSSSPQLIVRAILGKGEGISKSDLNRTPSRQDIETTLDEIRLEIRSRNVFVGI